MGHEIDQTFIKGLIGGMCLDQIVNNYIHPCQMDSGTRREDLLTSPEELQRMFILRKILDDMEDSQAIEFLIERLKSSKTNDEFFSAMKSGNGNGKKK